MPQPIQFYRKLNPQTNVNDFYRSDNNQYIGATQFGTGSGFSEVDAPTVSSPINSNNLIASPNLNLNAGNNFNDSGDSFQSIINSFISGVGDSNQSTSDFISAFNKQSATAPLETERTSLKDRLGTAFSKLGGVGSRIKQELSKFGYESNVQQLQEINTQIAAKTKGFAEANEKIRTNENITTSTGIGRQSQLERQKAIELGGLSITAQALQGNISLAMDTAAQTVEIEFAPLEQEINALESQLASNYDDLSRADKKQADELTIILNERTINIANAKEQKNQIYELMISAAQNGADNVTLSKISKSTDIETAIQNAGKFLQTPTDTDDTKSITDLAKDMYDSGDYNTYQEALNAAAAQFTGDGNVPQKNNNPGNVKVGGIADQYAMKDENGNPMTDEQGHLIFADAQAGTQGLIDDLQAKISGNSRWVQKDPTIAQVGKAYAEDPNWTNGVVSIYNANTGSNMKTTDKADKFDFYQLAEAVKTQEGYYVGTTPTETTGNLAVDGWVKQISEGNATIPNVPANLKNKVVQALSKVTTDKDSLEQTKAKSKIELIDSILEHRGMKKGVGTNIFGRWTPLRADVWTGEVGDFLASTKQLISQETLDTLLELKKGGGTLGALSDQERIMLQNAATKINSWAKLDKAGNVKYFNTTEKLFKAELNRMKKLVNIAVTSSTIPGLQTMDDGTQWVQNSDGTFTQINN